MELNPNGWPKKGIVVLERVDRLIEHMRAFKPAGNLESVTIYAHDYDYFLELMAAQANGAPEQMTRKGVLLKRYQGVWV